MKVTGRIHAPHVAALAHAHGSTIELRAPMPGHFIPEIGPGDLVSADERIGQLVVLGRAIAVTAGTAQGLAVAPGGPRAVAYGEPLVTLDLEAQLAAGGIAPGAAAAQAHAGDVFRAPTSGRFYGRPGPDKPPFVEPGTELVAGATVCLLEVMKTFHRVTYTGEPAKVRAVIAGDGDDVNAGDPLLALER